MNWKRRLDGYKSNRALKRAAQKPVLFHRLPDQDFDLAKSEVVRWLCEQQEIRQAVFDWCKDQRAIIFKNGVWHGMALKNLKAITFDRATGQWKGCDTP